jgi:hypothetical protein
MKIWLISLLSLVIGTAVGLGATWREFQYDSIGFSLLIPEEEEEAPLSTVHPDMLQIPEAGKPRLVVLEDTYNFGYMESGAEESHDFTIANDGDAPLELKVVKTTCKCMVGKHKKTDGDTIIVAPRSQEEITLTWTARSVPGEFRQNALMESNDPRKKQFALTIEGVITSTMTIFPTEIVLNSLSPSQPATGEARIYGNRKEPLEVLSCQVMEATSSELFEVTVERIPEGEKLPVEGATSGWVVRLSVKPGLPLGWIQQTIHLTTNFDTGQKVTIPVFGNVKGDLKVYGQDWDQDRGVLSIGTVASTEGAAARLFLVTRHKEIEVEVAQVEPALVQVEIGAPVVTGSAGAVRVPIAITIPQGAEAIDRLGGTAGPLGQLLLKTNHPEAGQVKVLLEFAVQR